MANQEYIAILHQGVVIWNDRGGGRLDLSQGETGPKR